MSHMSWQAWGKYRIERELDKDFKVYRAESVVEQAMSNVFVIVNEWDTSEGHSAEIVDGKWFTSESAAHDALRIIAESYHVDLHPTETSISLESHDLHIEFEEYYIQELTRG